MAFSPIIKNWYSDNKRNLPWRQSSDPYKIWLSEIILQQTRVAQGLPYYERFISHFPDVHSLAEAEEEQVLKLWQGLGYYSRARNLHHAARQVSHEMNGDFPGTAAGLKGLKGVGEYTAHAIASFCYNEPVAVVDGNVYRVLARYFGIDLPVNSTAGKKLFAGKAAEVLDKNDPATHNQAIMEFGALQCVPANPDCENCPLSKECVAFQTDRVSDLPVKTKKNKVKRRFFNYLVALYDNKVILQQRTGNDIWKNMYEFPLIETSGPAEREELQEKIRESSILPDDDFIMEPYHEEALIHKLSHQHIHTRFWIIHCNSPLEKAVDREKVNEYPMPVLVANFVRELDF
ncbi:A/G-specific adenine glycosylase [Robertkochia aurantiaca]|uniref:A/G-specific adenine glycosylase n=1 Tax=Robertkochia aurantiaca TaxID=2873700 RepID=UPI001CCCADCD|nr:A/G-specific adenine glycosylase [Robertkochia sp. 3YJGBD-33]